jgi:hypothetical protein
MNVNSPNVSRSDIGLEGLICKFEGKSHQVIIIGGKRSEYEIPFLRRDWGTFV